MASRVLLVKNIDESNDSVVRRLKLAAHIFLSSAVIEESIRFQLDKQTVHNLEYDEGFNVVTDMYSVISCGGDDSDFYEIDYIYKQPDDASQDEGEILEIQEVKESAGESDSKDVEGETQSKEGDSNSESEDSEKKDSEEAAYRVFDDEEPSWSKYVVISKPIAIGYLTLLFASWVVIVTSYSFDACMPKKYVTHYTEL